MNQNGLGDAGREELEHLSRIGAVCDGLVTHPEWGYPDPDEITRPLLDFDSKHWNFTKYLSLSLYEETTGLLHELRTTTTSKPDIAIVMPVYRPDPDLLARSVASALAQVGISARLYISLDGPDANHKLVERTLEEISSSKKQVQILSHPVNRGVALCRNSALQQIREDWFTFLDCDDIFHPLRCLHAWLALQKLGVQRLNTGYSRVCLREGKIVLLQQSLSAVGGNSFLACRSLLDSHGFLAPLRFYEDTEYQNRLAHFGVPMMDCSAVGHYQNTCLSYDYTSLATRWRKEAYQIEGHPWLCGTVMGAMDIETQGIRDQHAKIYLLTNQNELAAIFSAEGSCAIKGLAS